GVLRARGPDVVSFLQGQLSNDLALLSAECSQLAGYHNPQGRVIALLRLLQFAPDDLLALLPRELITPVAARLSRFVLRAKVKLAEEPRGWRVSGLMAGDSDAALPATENEPARLATANVVRLAPQPARGLLLSPVSQPPFPGTVPAADPLSWRRFA